MNLPTMTNEQFALWFAAGQGASKLYDNAEIVYKWLESKSKKPAAPISEPLTPKKK